MAKKKTREESQELKEIKRLKGVFVESPDGREILKQWVREYVHALNTKLDPVVEGKRAFVLELMGDLKIDLSHWYDDNEEVLS